jgi:hypothetical protein
VAEHRHERGLVDTSVVIDLDVIEPQDLPRELAVSVITLAELAPGPHATRMRASGRVVRIGCNALRPPSTRVNRVRSASADKRAGIEVRNHSRFSTIRSAAVVLPRTLLTGLAGRNRRPLNATVPAFLSDSTRSRRGTASGMMRATGWPRSVTTIVLPDVTSRTHSLSVALSSLISEIASLRALAREPLKSRSVLTRSVQSAVKSADRRSATSAPEASNTSRTS